MRAVTWRMASSVTATGRAKPSVAAAFARIPGTSWASARHARQPAVYAPQYPAASAVSRVCASRMAVPCGRYCLASFATLV